MLKRLARNPSTASLTPATTNTENAISIWLDAMAQTMIGTRRMRARVIRLGILFGILTRRFPATGLILEKSCPQGGQTERYLHSPWEDGLRAIACRRNPT